MTVNPHSLASGLRGQSRSVMMGVPGHGQEGESKVPQMLPLDLSLRILETWGELSASVAAGSQSPYGLPGAQHHLGVGTGSLWGLVEAHHSTVRSSTVNVPGKHPRARGLLTTCPRLPIRSP